MCFFVNFFKSNLFPLLIKSSGSYRFARAVIDTVLYLSAINNGMAACYSYSVNDNVFDAENARGDWGILRIRLAKLFCFSL